MDERRRVRTLGAWWVHVAALALVVLFSDAVGGWNYMYGDRGARFAGLETIVYGILLAGLIGLLVGAAVRLASGGRAVRLVGRALIGLAVLGPVTATQAYIEWDRHQRTGESAAAQMEREALEQFGAVQQGPPPMTGVEAVLAQIVPPDAIGTVSEMDASHQVLRFGSADPVAEVGIFRANLVGSGWVVGQGEGPLLVTATRDGYEIEVRADWTPVDTGPCLPRTSRVRSRPNRVPQSSQSGAPTPRPWRSRRDSNVEVTP